VGVLCSRWQGGRRLNPLEGTAMPFHSQKTAGTITARWAQSEESPCTQRRSTPVGQAAMRARDTSSRSIGTMISRRRDNMEPMTRLSRSAAEQSHKELLATRLTVRR
jgi:hypothetical protein